MHASIPGPAHACGSKRKQAVGHGASHVVQDGVRVQVEACGDGADLLRTECALRVNVGHLHKHVRGFNMCCIPGF